MLVSNTFWCRFGASGSRDILNKRESETFASFCDFTDLKLSVCLTRMEICILKNVCKSFLMNKTYLTFLSFCINLEFELMAHDGVTLAVCRTPLHAASVAEDVSGLLLILRMGADINAVDHSGRSALMMAADTGKSGAVGKSCRPWVLSHCSTCRNNLFIY